MLFVFGNLAHVLNWHKYEINNELAFWPIRITDRRKLWFVSYNLIGCAAIQEFSSLSDILSDKKGVCLRVVQNYSAQAILLKCFNLTMLLTNTSSSTTTCIWSKRRGLGNIKINCFLFKFRLGLGNMYTLAPEFSKVLFSMYFQRPRLLWWT